MPRSLLRGAALGWTLKKGEVVIHEDFLGESNPPFITGLKRIKPRWWQWLFVRDRVVDIDYYSFGWDLETGAVTTDEVKWRVGEGQWRMTTIGQVDIWWARAFITNHIYETWQK